VFDHSASLTEHPKNFCSRKILLLPPFSRDLPTVRHLATERRADGHASRAFSALSAWCGERPRRRKKGCDARASREISADGHWAIGPPPAGVVL
jgi:hypothetical protein